jgi:predicted Rossmann-fold nucleotide-binding protein
MITAITVYGASSNAIDKVYIETAELLGERLAENGIDLVFGGGASGVMGATARGAQRKNGKIIKSTKIRSDKYNPTKGVIIIGKAVKEEQSPIPPLFEILKKLISKTR